tara:strand:- start:1203 stop:1697 length:495 start_codon:yes stop_codon:yes gene_type:complete
MKRTLLLSLTFIILTLFIFSGDILLKINDSILGKLFFVCIIMLYAHEHTLYGLIAAIAFFVVNEKFTYAYYEGMSLVNDSGDANNPVENPLRNLVADNVKPTSAGIVELTQQLKSVSPRTPSLSCGKQPVRDVNIDIINLGVSQKSGFVPIASDLETTNLFSTN